MTASTDASSMPSTDAGSTASTRTPTRRTRTPARSLAACKRGSAKIAGSIGEDRGQKAGTTGELSAGIEARCDAKSHAFRML
jgi:hypothetical protein